MLAPPVLSLDPADPAGRTVTWPAVPGALDYTVAIADLQRWTSPTTLYTEYPRTSRTSMTIPVAPGQFLSVGGKTNGPPGMGLDSSWVDHRDQVQIFDVPGRVTYPGGRPVIGLGINAAGNGNQSALYAYRSFGLTDVRRWREHFTELDDALDGVVRLAQRINGRILFTAMISPGQTPAQYGDLIAALVAKYGAVTPPMTIEAHNEPFGNIYNMAPEEYVDYVVAAYTAMRSVSRDARLLAAFDPGYGGSDHAIGRTLRYRPDLARYFSGGAIHAYPQAGEVDPARRWQWLQFCDAFPGKNVWVTEIGRPTVTASVPVLTGNGAPGVTEVEQAAWLARLLPFVRRDPRVTGMFLYMDRDLRDDVVYPLDADSERRFGVALRADGSAKPALAVLRSFAA